MFILKPSDDARHPINRSSRSISGIGEGEAFDALREKGAQIYLITSRYKLHDKMLIVDSRFVVIGNANWSGGSLNRSSKTVVKNLL